MQEFRCHHSFESRVHSKFPTSIWSSDQVHCVALFIKPLCHVNVYARKHLIDVCCHLAEKEISIHRLCACNPGTCGVLLSCERWEKTLWCDCHCISHDQTLTRPSSCSPCQRCRSGLHSWQLMFVAVILM